MSISSLRPFDLGTQGRFMAPRTIFVCLLPYFSIYAFYALIMHIFGVTVHVQYNSKKNFDKR